MSIWGLGENSCSISSMGKIGSRSAGVSGKRVRGLSGGSSGSGRDGSTLTQAVGIWLSARRNLECSCMGRPIVIPVAARRFRLEDLVPNLAVATVGTFQDAE